MNIKRPLAVILAVLALLSFVGCNVKKDTGKESLNAAGGKADEAISENQPESTDAQTSDTVSETDSNEASSSGNAETAKETQKPTAAATAKPNKPDIKNSKYFLGTDLNDWYHWNQIGEGYEEGTEYTAIWEKEYNSNGNIAKQITYSKIGEQNLPKFQRLYEYTFNGNGTVKEIRCSGSFNIIYRYEYDSAKRITKITTVDPNSGETTDTMTLSYNKSGKLAGVNYSEFKLRFSYDRSERVVKKEKTYPDGTVKAYLYEYNSRNDISRITEDVKYPNSTAKSTTDYKYDENGALIKRTIKTTDGMMYVREYKNDKYGNPIEIKETKSENGKVISSYAYPYTYKYEGNKITVTSHDYSKKIYGYQKNESIITPQTNLF